MAINDPDENESRIYGFVQENESITNSQACEILGLKSSRAREILKSMTERELLIPIGNGKGRRYIITQ